MKIAANLDCLLAENPLWDANTRSVYWTDIPAGKIHQLPLDSGVPREIYHGPLVGGFTQQKNGDLLLFREKDIALLKANNGAESLRIFQDEGSARFNDVIADPAGRVFAGTIGKTKQSGGLFRVNLDATYEKLYEGTGCSNGMGFSPDLKRFYWTCSTTRRIYEFDYDEGSGRLGSRRLFYEATPDEGIPDGLAIDASGQVWSARWGGSCIRKHAGDGSVLQTFMFPVKNITSLCFGGDNLDELFVTSAKEPGEESPEAGALFHLPVEAKGMKRFRSNISTT